MKVDINATEACNSEILGHKIANWATIQITLAGESVRIDNERYLEINYPLAGRHAAPYRTKKFDLFKSATSAITQTKL